MTAAGADNAGTLAFGGGGLDRAAHLRAQACHDLAGARVLPMWRGEPLVLPDGLAWVAPGAPILAGAGEAVFLGLDPRGARLLAAPVAARAAAEAGGGGQGLGFGGDGTPPHPDAPPGAAFRDLRAVALTLTPLEAEVAATARALLGWHATHGFCAACGTASHSADGGWVRRCPACGAQHFPRTDPVVIMLVLRGNSVLVGRNAAWPAGMYSLLAGFMEPGETVAAAVRREVFEETGIRIGAVRLLASQPWPFPASLMLGAVAEALDTAITLDPVELEDALWLTREEMAEVMAGRNPAVRPARKGAIAHVLVRNWLADRLD
jgi:NAD+ diphosphatase